MSRKSIFYSSLSLLILELGMVGLSLTLLLMNLGVVKVAELKNQTCSDPNSCSLWQFSAHVLSSNCSRSVKEWSNPDVSCVPAKYYMGVQLAVSVLLVAVAAFTCIRSRKLSAASKYIWLFVALPAMIVVTCFGVFMFIEYHHDTENPALLVLGFIWCHFFLPIFLVTLILFGMRGYPKPSDPHKDSPPYGQTSIRKQSIPHVTSKTSRSVQIVTKDPAQSIERPPSVPLSSFQNAASKTTVTPKPSFSSPSRETVTSRDMVTPRDTVRSRNTSPHGTHPVSRGHSSGGHDNPALTLEERQNVGTQDNDWQNRINNDWHNRIDPDWQPNHEEERARSQSPKKYTAPSVPQPEYQQTGNSADIQEILRHGDGRRSGRSRSPSVVSSGGAWSPGGSRRGSRTIRQPETPAVDYNTMIQPPKPAVPARKPKFGGYDSRPFSYLTPQFRPEALDVQAMKDHHVDIVKSLSDDMTRNSFRRKESLGRASRGTSPLDTQVGRALSPNLEKPNSPPQHPPGYPRALSPEQQRALSPELERASSPHGTIV